MKITLADKFIAWLTLLSGLSISAVAVYYSVAGLISIFAAAVIPIAVMGVTLELSKLVATVWLKQNWAVAPRFIKAYLLAAIAILMLITSMGIFGYLSKAHSDQTLVSGDVQSKIAIYDEKIKTARENIEANRRQLKQMDEAVDQVMARSTSEEGATKANNIRKSQQRDRVALAKDIEANQKLIAQLNDESAPIRAEIRKVEAEVGPIKYIAALIYGDNPDTNLLERAVRWVIIIIVVVFDPLAVILLLASQYSFMWFRKQEESTWLDDQEQELNDAFSDKEFEDTKEDDLFPTYDEITPKAEEPAPHHPDTHPYLRQGFKYPEGWQHQPPMVAKQENDQELEAEKEQHDVVEDIAEEATEQEQLEDKTPEEIIDEGLKSAKQQWKSENPADTIKHQERLYELGMIDQLPWEKVEELDAQKEEESKKKSSYMMKEGSKQVKKTKE